MPNKAETPIVTSYRPEPDVSLMLGPTGASYYMSLIGLLTWICELGRFDFFGSIQHVILYGNAKGRIH